MPGPISVYIGGASGGRKPDSTRRAATPLGAPSSSGARDFLGLSDTPISYEGQSGNTLIVNPGEDGLIFAVGGGGGGSSTFLGLTDSPISYEGQGYKLLGVKSSEDGLEYVDADFAPTVHTHVEANITNLDKYTQAAADAAFAPMSHNHLEINITDLDKYTQAEVDSLVASITSNDISAILQYGNTSSSSGLGFTVQDAIDILDQRIDDLELSPVIHTHNESQITDLDKYTQSAADAAFAPMSHNHLEINITDLDKYTQSEVDSLIAGVEGGGGESGSNTVVIRLLGSDLTDTFERSIFSAPTGGCIIDNIRIVPDVAISANASHYCTLGIINKGTGVDNNSVISLAFDSNSASAFSSTDMGTLSSIYKDLDTDDSLTLKKTVTGNGMQTPDMIVVIDFSAKSTSSSSA